METESAVAAVISKLRQGETPPVSALLATLNIEGAPQSTLERCFTEVIAALLEYWQPSNGGAVQFVIEGMKRFQDSVPCLLQAAAALRRCLQAAATGAVYVEGLLQQHDAPGAVLSAALSHPSNRTLVELALAFGDAAKGGPARKHLAECNFFAVAMAYASLAGPGGHPVRWPLCRRRSPPHKATREVARPLAHCASAPAPPRRPSPSP